MDHSLAQTIELQCPQCGARFAAAVWLIVDAGARPELLARVADGSLHTVVCPNGHGGAVDAPLLLYRPGATPTLLFSPATQTTAEQDAEMAQGLVGRLRETLGGAWRDEWLGELSPLPREALAALARGDEAGAAEALRAATAAALPPAVARALADIAGLLAAEGVRVESAEDLDRALAARPELRARLEAALRDAAPGPSDAGQTAAAPPPPPLPPEEEPGEALPPLLQALADWIETPDWLESYRFLLAHSELLTDEADALLGQLLEGASEAGDEGATRLFTEHRALLQRSRAAGAAAAFAEKMGTTAEQLEAATRAAPAAAAIPPETRRALDEIMAALAAEGVRPGSPEEFEAALAARPELAAKLQAAAGNTGRGPDMPPEFRDDVRRAQAAEARYRATSDPAALDEAAAAWERILGSAQFETAPETFRLAAYNAAAIAIIRRYQVYGQLPDLDRALALWQAAVAGTPAGSPDRAMYQSNLGNGLRARYGRTGAAADLDAAIAAWEAAVAGTPAGSPDLAGRQSNLGAGLRARYGRTGAAADLDAAIVAFEVAVAGTPAGSPDRAMYQSNLGAGLSDRYGRTGAAADLDAAIAAYETAVAGTPAGSPDLAAIQSNLGNGLRDRYARTGLVADLDAAIAAFEAAVAGTPAGSPDLAGRQSNLGIGLRDRYGRTGAAADLDAAIAAYEAAVACPPAGSPDLAGRQNNLGAGLRDRYGRTGAAADLNAAIAAYEAAVRGTPAGSPDRAGRQNNLGTGLRDRYGRTGAAADLDAAIAAVEAAVAGTPAGSPDRAGYQSNLGNGLRDRYGRTGAAADLDAAIAAWQAAVAGTPAGSPDRAGYQSNLGTGLRDRYRRTGTAADLDAAIGVFTAAVDTLDGALLDSPVAFVIGQQSRWAGLHARAVATLVAAGRVAEALAVAEGTKSRLLAGLMGRGELPAPADLPADLVARERAAAERLRALDARELAGHVRAPGSGGDRPAVAGRTAIVDALRAIWAEMAAAGPKAAEYVALRRGDRPTAAGLARLAGALPPGTALLSIFDPAETVPAPAGEDGAWQRLLLFLWPAGAASPRVVAASLDPDARRYDYLANYEDEVLNRGEQARLGRPVTQRWRGLGVPLLGPLRPYLDGIDHLIISPERLYHQLPLHALWLSDAGDTLLDHCAVSTIPALGLLERLRGAESAPAAASGGRSAVFGYTPADGATKSGADERRVFLGEAEAVAARLGVAPLLDDAATSEGLEKATAAPLRVLHLSCHGGFSAGDALASGVRLADGVYTARRFLERRLVVDLVTLSACQTGISSSLGGDEMAGLSMALLSAGAASLLLGLWSVNAVTTALLMDDFYARLAAGGVGKAEALRRTMLAFRAGAIVPPQASFDPADAYYWAPFVLVGDWR